MCPVASLEEEKIQIIKCKISIYRNVNIFLPTDFVDKRGSRVEKTSKEDLHRFYEMSDESDKGRISTVSESIINLIINP